MKPEGQVRHKLVQVRFRHLKREIRGGLSRRPQNCVHNGTVRGPAGALHVCMKGADAPETWEGSPCDERYGGDARAAKCPFFACSQTKETLREGFDGFLDGASLPEIADRYPDMAALMWVLEEEVPPPAPLTDEEPSEEPPPPPVEPPTPDPTPDPPAPPPEESGVEDPEDDSEDDDEEELARSLAPFRPPTWKLLFVSALLYVQRRVEAMLEAMRRG